MTAGDPASDLSCTIDYRLDRFGRTLALGVGGTTATLPSH